MIENLNYSIVDTKHGKFGYLKLGVGQPLVMIVRYGATLYNWDRFLVHELSKHFTLYLIEPRCIGLSKSNNPETIAGYADDIKEVIDTLKIKQPLILGWSFGAGVVQEFCRLYSNSISGIILISAFPNAHPGNPEFIKLSMDAGSDNDKTRLYELMFSEKFDLDAQKKLKDNYLLISNYDYRFNLEAKVAHNNIIHSWSGSAEEDLKNIKVNTLIIRAKDDMAFSLDAGLTLLRNIKLSKFILYSTGGHLLIHKHGKSIAKDIINHFIV